MWKPPEAKQYCLQNAVQVMLDPGDFLAWDSRVVHCSSGIDPQGKFVDLTAGADVDVADAATQVMTPGRESEVLARLAAYISMVPRVGQNFDEKRRKAVEVGRGSGHDPFQLNNAGGDSIYFRYQTRRPDDGDACWRLV